MPKRGLTGLGLFTFWGFTIRDFATLDETFLGLQIPRTRNAEKGLNGSWPFHISGFYDLGFCDPRCNVSRPSSSRDPKCLKGA
jgi:hypothetical protein